MPRINTQNGYSIHPKQYAQDIMSLEKKCPNGLVIPITNAPAPDQSLLVQGNERFNLGTITNVIATEIEGVYQVQTNVGGNHNFQVRIKSDARA